MPDMRCESCKGVFWWMHKRDYCRSCQAKLELGILK